MTEPPPICLEILPRWLDYQRDPENQLDTFLYLLNQDMHAIEDRYEIEFGNPSVKAPAEESEAYAKEIRLKWDPEKADKAALALVKSLMYAYKTAAAHLIVAARKSIETCGSEQISFYIEKHREARSYYGMVKDTSVSINDVRGLDIVALVDETIRNYCNAIRTVMLAFC